MHVKREELEKHDPELLTVFALRIKEKLQLKNIKLRGRPGDLNMPCCSKNTEIEVELSIPHILLVGYRKTQNVKMNDYPARLHPMIQSAMEMYLQNLADGKINVALKVIHESRKVFT
ncbi:hypothetical protein M3P05_10290 [Sansalvadorimonas sp. 2012CJ34-2]|uniref:Uncharacterized protein n=1 Tax=Parendozoicomonas callyspongiae TaxID=2942213 RepID=A0ABT0PG42_9GAMM|nr:hypothetical protein [Sansalvadorimonas sp. 2012CJ34-2]MCL6270308.1 hypothetical protein [Sansalvadorimonas sp. 2012CJ34-2]